MAPKLLLVALSTYKFERQNFRYGRRNEPKFGTHVRIDTLTLKKLTHPTPGGFSGLLDVVRSFVRSFVRATAVLAAKLAERHDRTTTHDRPRTTTNDRPRTHDRPRTSDRARPCTTDRARTTTHARPRTTDHA